MDERLAQMSESELRDAISIMEDEASNVSHGEREGYVVGLWRTAHMYRTELKRREEKHYEQADDYR